MVTDQKHLSNSIASEQKVIRHTEKTAWLFGLDEQNARAYKALSEHIWVLEKRPEDYHFEYVKLKRKVNLLKAELEDLDEYVDRETVVDLIQEKVPSLIGKKGKVSCCSFYSSESSEDSDLDEIIEGSHRYQPKHIGELGITNHDESNSIETLDVSYSTLGKVNLYITFNDGKKHKSIPNDNFTIPFEKVDYISTLSDNQIRYD
ncbi:hypothetical protein C1646_770051 [Rhizophagus diaphanus]|nr:hypothetical protein C1646_770051 [Rhizophagus diaphanus] [Rhizophagus sp. MUCL 43196]